MSQIIKRPFKSFNGYDWDQHYFETSADQVVEDSSHRFITDNEKNKIFSPEKKYSPSSGYVKLANGLIIQWGVNTATSPARWIAYPISYPNNGFSVQCCGIQGKYGITINAQNNSGFEALYSGSADFYWVSIGY